MIRLHRVSTIVPVQKLAATPISAEIRGKGWFSLTERCLSLCTEWTISAEIMAELAAAACPMVSFCASCATRVVWWCSVYFVVFGVTAVNGRVGLCGPLSLSLSLSLCVSLSLSLCLSRYAETD